MIKKRKKLFESSKNKPIEKDIDVSLIEPNKWNPNVMSDDKFSELVKNIEEIDDVQRVLVVKDKEKYRIVDGEHRFRALKVIGRKKIPCIVVQMEGEDRQQFISMRMNIIKGKIDPVRFTAMYDKLAKKYGKEATRTMMSLVEEAEFERVYKEVRKELPPELRKKLDETKSEVQTIEGLSQMLNTLFSKYGTTLDYNFMWFDYGGKKNMMIKCSKLLWAEVEKIGKMCYEEKKDINIVMEKLVKTELIK